ncbi:MAG TPA: pitrilysin family protein [Ignavibacteriaceae bacterium]|nr:pitrilysin family protein [Ignavibacteriaceae bacterium]
MHNFRVTTLPNSIRLVSEYLPYLQSFSLGFWINVGTRDESINNNGISHFIEHMVFKGTKKRSAKRISEEIESYGGYINAFTSKEHTCYYSKGLPKNLGRTFSVLSDMIQNPLFKDHHIKREAGVVLDELKDIDDNPEELIYDKFEEVIFRGNSLSLPVIGVEKNIKKFNSGELLKYHNDNYNRNKLLIVASGAVSHDELIKLAEKYIERNSIAQNKKRQNFNPKKADDLIIEKDFQQVHTILGRTTYGLKNERRMMIKVLSAVLGQGSSSRLFQAVREKLGITYQIHSFLNSYYDTSAFGIYYSTNPKQTTKVLEIVNREMQKLKEKKISERELQRVKEYLKGSTLLSLESTTNRMIRMANAMLYFGRVITIEEFLKKIDYVTVKDIFEVANEVLDNEKLIKVILKSSGESLKIAA